jgi:hypothetical protein
MLHPPKDTAGSQRQVRLVGFPAVCRDGGKGALGPRHPPSHPVPECQVPANGEAGGPVASIQMRLRLLRELDHLLGVTARAGEARAEQSDGR